MNPMPQIYKASVSNGTFGSYTVGYDQQLVQEEEKQNDASKEDIYDELIISIAKYLRLNEKTKIKHLRKMIGDYLIGSNEDYSEDIYKTMDKVLMIELKKRNNIINADIDIPFINDDNSSKIKLWQGDITRLNIDGIVNAANTKGLGCFQAHHKCIDNIIHRKSGPRLRKECREILNTDLNEPLPTSTAIITKGYCLPSKYIIHTPGPVGEKPKLLKACYENVLNLCKENGLRSIAFCCISTGLFGYPNENAAKVAIHTVKKWLNQKDNNQCIDYVLFNVFLDKDLHIYQTLLK